MTAFFKKIFAVIESYKAVYDKWITKKKAAAAQAKTERKASQEAAPKKVAEPVKKVEAKPAAKVATKTSGKK